ncbi:MAG: methyltransferase [Epsilonproteobacteria bacterium]|nr:methyltransferase [Campylobacterota bacterium]
MSLYEILGQLYQKKMHPKHIKEFDRFANGYERYKIIQTRVAQHLIQKTSYKGRNILDLGAGSGEIYRAIDWEFDRFYALDLAQNMLRFHPETKVEKILCNFDEDRCWKRLTSLSLSIDQIFASSSLQWSKDLDTLLTRMRSLDCPVSAALFTSGTFKTIHEILQVPSPVRSKEEVLSLFCQHFMIDYEIKRYKLFFPDSKSMFSYIKKSGVSSGHKRTSIGKLKELIRSYPHPYLEFEVVFLWSKE